MELRNENNFISPEEQMKVIKNGLLEIINEEELLEKLQLSTRTGKPLVVKLGLDPSAPDIHLGHAVVLRKIRQMQKLGHRAVIIIGDFTGMIGDPTGRSKVRKQLSKEEVLENALTYEKQIFKILDPNRTEVRFNSEWLSKLNFEEVIKLAGRVTVARILERDDFENRYKCGQPIGLHEFFYPLMQAYDSVHIQSDIELGGTDQRFNILMGRTLQKDYNLSSQIAMFVPILEGTDGIEKMSKSLGNYIGVNEDANTIYRKVMTIPDSLIIKYFKLATDLHPDEIDSMEKELENGETNPRDIKMALACEITALYHGIDKAEEAEQNFQQIFQRNQIPDNIDTFSITSGQIERFVDKEGRIELPRLITELRIAKSNSEARRLLSQNAVKINGERWTELTIKLDGEFILQVGKANFVKVCFPNK
ncbi:MAG TPA: tyrosine--tRNA ligase [Lachnospiraceae bacterium]|nr:tyrosine--tRNA ligase [Lachnospiraceae bacterium]